MAADNGLVRRRGARILGVVVLIASALVIVLPATAVAAAPNVSVSPVPGDKFANPRTTISFRGASLAAIGSITVTGTQSGAHQGMWTEHSDGNGASFAPALPFIAGETVTVKTNLDINGGNDGTFSFTTAPIGSVQTTNARDGEFAVRKSAATPNVVPTSHFVTRPDLQPPTLTVNTSTGTPEPGLIITTPRGGPQVGPLLVDNTGSPVWFNPVANVDFVTDAKVVTYQGQSDLAWWQGQLLDNGHGAGTYELVNNHYQPVAAINAGNGDQTDLHDMLITPQNTAIVMAYVPVGPMNLTAFGGSATGTVTQLVVQEIDIATGAVMLEWDSLNDVPLSTSVAPAPAPVAPPGVTPSWDYFHGNGFDLTSDGNLLVSGRHTSQIYKIDLHSGDASYLHPIWTLGRGGSFAPSGFADANWFAFQHDIRERSDGTISVFDNGAGIGPPPRNYSRGLIMTLDMVHMTVSINKEVRIPSPPNVSAASQGSFRELGNGHNFIGWGAVGEATEFNAADAPILDLLFPANVGSYRAVKEVWHAAPTTLPDVVIQRNGTSVSATVSWNGSTDVARWRLRAGNAPDNLHSISSSGRHGFETTVTATSDAPILDMQALDAQGNILVTSALVSASGTPDHSGYWMGEANGSVHTFGAIVAQSVTPSSGQHLVAIAGAPGGNWTVTSDGTVTAPAGEHYGDLHGVHLHAPIVGIAPTLDRRGYWLVASDGGVFTFGNAKFRGSMGGVRLAAPVVGMAATPDGNGYWLAARDGGVFTFGSAKFRGSAGGTHLNAPVVGIAAGVDDNGYFLGASDGGVFTYGTAHFHGSAGGTRLNAPVVGIATTSGAGGYWLVARDGGVFTYGDARFRGSLAGTGAVVVAFAHD
jgi:hypothetical protein